MNQDERYALVTGASSGIGLAYSRELARRGYPLLMVSNEETKLFQAAQAIQAEFQVTAIPLYLDLAQQDAAPTLFNYCAENAIAVHIMINNAGMFFFKDIASTAPERLAVMINLHTLTPALLCRLFTQQMIDEKRSGYLLNMSSIAAWMMMPGIAAYSATKSFVHCFSRAMRNELYDQGISITAVCPGAVATGLYNLPQNYQQLGIRLGIIMPTEQMARRALNKMFQRKAEYIPGGLVNRLFIALVASLPQPLIRWIWKKIKAKTGM